MGIKLLWLGLTLITAFNVWNFGVPAVQVVGAVIMIIGVILYLLDK